MNNALPTIRCDGVRRRDLLKVGALTGLGLNLVDWFRGQAQGNVRSGGSAKACILLWLDGGPSHLETFDPKPSAPAEVRGPFGSIATGVPGIHLSELLPETARQVDKLAIIRSMTSPLGEHGLANHYLLTGHEPSPAVSYPSYGSVMAHQHRQLSALPAYVAIPAAGMAGAGFLGPGCEPFQVAGDPGKPDFRVRDLDFFPAVNVERIERRREFLEHFDRQQATWESRDLPTDHSFGQAFQLITSAEAKSAFRLDQEAADLRARYGMRAFGQSCLLARRLVERGVSFVTVNFSGWDTHNDLVLQLKSGYAGANPGVGLVPTFDLGFSALVQDLAQRGLLAETLVVAMGEFGRTPKLNPQGGRDHWPRVFSVVLAGGGIQGGQVIGASDRVGESPAEQPVTPKDLAFSLFTRLGIDPHTILTTPDGRPITLNQGGSPIKGLDP
jgi:hypothetical protein